MKRCPGSFNIYFTVLCFAVLAGGCSILSTAAKATSRNKEYATIRLYLEGDRVDKSSSATVLVTSNKFRYTIQKDPFLDEGHLAKAFIVDDPDGSFYIQLNFNDHGTLLLDMYTASSKGKHIIIFSQFPMKGVKPLKEKKKKTEDKDDSDVTDQSLGPKYPPGTPRQSGWLAAVLIRDRISSGIFRFTPDASHAEGVRIVRQLKNVIAENGEDKKDKN